MVMSLANDKKLHTLLLRLEGLLLKSVSAVHLSVIKIQYNTTILFSFKAIGPYHTCMYVNSETLCDVLRYQYVNQHKIIFLEQYSP